MKNLLSVFIIIFFRTLLFSQNVELNKAIEYFKSGDLINAKKVIDEVVNDNKTKKEPKAWMYRGFIYQTIYESTSDKYKNLDKDAINVSYQSYLKAISCDSIKEYSSNIIKSLKILSSEFVYEGVKEFNDANYDKSYINFDNSLKINSMPSIMMLDTIIIYNAALAAEKANKFEKAEELYTQLITFKFGGAKIYLDLANIYKIQKKKDLMVKTLKNGIEYFPNDLENKYLLINELINYYLDTWNNDEALKYIELGLEIKPGNSSYYYVLGSLYEQKRQNDKAEYFYKQAVLYDSTNVDALYNLGVLYYNQGVDLIKKSMDKTQKAAADAKYAQALPYFEKVLVLTPNEIETMKLLKNIYAILKMEDKLNNINKLIELNN